MTLDDSSLMLIRHDCVNSKGLGDCQKAWQLLQQRFRSDETTTVINLMRQLARIQLWEDKAIQQYFIRAQKLVTRLHHAGEELSETLFNVERPSTTIRAFCGAGELQSFRELCGTQEASHQLWGEPQTERWCGGGSARCHVSKEGFSLNWYTLFIKITSYEDFF